MKITRFAQWFLLIDFSLLLVFQLVYGKNTMWTIYDMACVLLFGSFILFSKK